MPRRIVIVGNGSAGASVAFTARKNDRTAEITVLERLPYPTFSKCALTFVIEGTIDSFKTITVFSHEFYRSQKVNLVNGATVTRVIPDEKKVIYRDTGGEKTIEYDALALTLGARPFVPKIPGTDLDGVFTLRTIGDGEKILAATKNARKAIVNGASFIGLEIAEALTRRGLDTTVIVRSRVLRTMVDADFSRELQEHMLKHGCKFIQDKCVDVVLGAGGKVKAAVVSHEEVPADIVIMATGVRPDVELAKQAGLKIGPAGGVVVDGAMRTSVPDIYAAGDCAEDRFGLMGFPFISFLGTVATRQGVVAGMNMVGMHTEAPKFYNAAIMTFFGMQVGSVGLTTDIAQEHGLKVESIKVTHSTLPHYYPGGKPVTVKLLAHPETQELVGAQVVAEETVPETINTLSLAIQNRMKAAELAMADFCYSPPCADIWAPASVAAQGLERKFAAKARRAKQA
jgi:NADH oxidase (H2O2-forming)